MVRRELILKQSDLLFILNSLTQDSFLSVVSSIRNPSGHKTVLPTGKLKLKIGREIMKLLRRQRPLNPVYLRYQQQFHILYYKTLKAYISI